MARLYSDENFPVPVCEWLRILGHDVLTCQESGRHNQKIADEHVLSFAIAEERAVLTKDRGDYKRLHRRNSNHFGIVVCTNNDDFEQMAQCIHRALVAHSDLTGRLLRVYRPG